VFFIRVRGRLSNPEFRVAGDQAKAYGKVAECLFVKKLCVIPPTIHPDTERAYRYADSGRSRPQFRDDCAPL
jgi:hypothetical protein